MNMQKMRTSGRLGQAIGNSAVAAAAATIQINAARSVRGTSHPVHFKVSKGPDFTSGAIVKSAPFN